MTPTDQQALINRLLEVLCPLVAHLCGGGRDSNGIPIPGLQARIDSIPEQVRDLAAWVDSKTRTSAHGTWWCNSHERRATYITPDGRRMCDPKLGGILLPCQVVFVEAIITEDTHEQRNTQREV